MAVTILIPITHRSYAGGRRTDCVEARTLGEALTRLQQVCPDLDRRIIRGRTALLPGLEIAINGRAVFPFVPEMGVEDGDEIRISSIITGG